MMDILLVVLVASNWIVGLYLLLRAGAPEKTAILKVSVPMELPSKVIHLRRRPLRLAAA